MIRIKMTIATFLLAAVSVLSFAEDAPALNEHLKTFEPMIGTWEGEFKNTEPGQSIKDTVTYEVILNGNAVRAVHEVTGGYGGETIYCWNPVTGEINFWYYTNSGQYAEGTFDINGEEMLFSAIHYGGSVSGWTATAKMIGADSFESAARYYQSGKWVDGHSVTYKKVN